MRLHKPSYHWEDVVIVFLVMLMAIIIFVIDE